MIGAEWLCAFVYAGSSRAVQAEVEVNELKRQLEVWLSPSVPVGASSCFCPAAASDDSPAGRCAAGQNAGREALTTMVDGNSFAEGELIEVRSSSVFDGSFL